MNRLSETASESFIESLRRVDGELNHFVSVCRNACLMAN